MSKTFNVNVALSIKLVLDDETIQGMRKYIATRRLPKEFCEYLDTLDDEAMLMAFIKRQTTEWFKGELEENRQRDPSQMTYAPVRVQVQEKAH